MRHDQIYSWAEEQSKANSYSQDDKSDYDPDEDQYEEPDRMWQIRKTRARLDDKYLSFAETNADVDDPWRPDDDEESVYSRRASGNEENWRPNVHPEPLRPKRSDTTKVAELHHATEPEWNDETRSKSSGSTMKSHPTETVEDLQMTLEPKGKSPLQTIKSKERPTSKQWSLTPSDAPYRFSWLNKRKSEGPSQPKRTSMETPVTRMYGNPYDDHKDHLAMHNVDVDFVPKSAHVQRPPSTYQPDWYRETLQPDDSISSFEPHLRLRGGGNEPISVLRPERISIPPQLPPGLNTSSSNASSNTYANTIQPSYQDVEMGPIRSVPLEKLPERFQPEPLNGRTAKLHALSGFLIAFNCWGIGNAFGLFQAYYETIYLRGTSPAAIAWIGSTQLALVFGLGIPVGRLIDMGYFAIVFHTGTFLVFLGLLCTSWCKSIGTLWLVQGLITGSGMGMVFCAGIVAMMTWFDEQHLSMAMGVGAAGSCVGGIVYVLIARSLLASHGFSTTLQVLAVVVLVTMLPANAIFRIRGQTHKISLRGHRSSRVAPPTTPSPGWKSFREPAYLLAAGGMFFSFLGVYFGFVYMVSYGLVVLKMVDTAASNLLIFMLLANLPGRFLPALISDKCIGPLNTMIPSVILSGAVVFLWSASAQNTASLTVIACFYGFVSAGVQVLYASTMYSFCVEPAREGETQPRTDRMGIKAGGIQTCMGLACLVGTPIGGALISYRTSRDFSSPYLGAQIFAAISLLIGGGLLLGSRVAKVGWKPIRA